MAQIVVRDLHIHLPIFNIHALSLKKNLLRLGSGGRIHTSAKTIVVEALRGVSLTLGDGDRLGVIGYNGAGKSTLLRALAGVYHPTSGSVATEGKLVTLLSSALGMYEDASGYENIRIGAMHVGMTPAEVEEKIEEIAAATELGPHLYLPLYTYSDGMRMRLSFTVATATAPEILILDEVIGTGDASFMHKASARLQGFVDRCKIVVLASHSVEWIRGTCNKVLLLNQGRPVAFGPPEDVLALYDKMATGG